MDGLHEYETIRYASDGPVAPITLNRPARTAQQLAPTGRPLMGRQAAEIELINRAVPFERLETDVAELRPMCSGRSSTG